MRLFAALLLILLLLPANPAAADSVAGTLEAAEKGDAQAQYGIGTMYDTGVGVKEDHEEAYFWYLLVEKTQRKETAVAREAAAAKEASDFSRYLSPGQKAAAERRVQEWMKAHPAAAAPPEAAGTANIAAYALLALVVIAGYMAIRRRMRKSERPQT